MSRRAGYPVVVVEGEDGAPQEVRRAGEEGDLSHRPGFSQSALPILRVLTYHREWIGVLDGEPERDVFLVETPDGICEIHRLRAPARAAAEGDAACAAEKAAVPAKQTEAAATNPPPPAPDCWVLARWED